MSIRVMTTVWDNAPYEGGELLVLLALADWADDKGRCWPSVNSIAHKARMSERQVYRVLQKLRADRILESEPGGGRANVSAYLINTDILSGFIPQPKPCHPRHKNPDMDDKSPRPPNRKNRYRTVSSNPPTPLRTRKGERFEDPAVIDIARMVAAQCKFTSERTTRAIAAVLSLEQSTSSLADTAERLVKAWLLYRDDAEWLRYTWGPPRFFAEGHWQNNASWPYDEERLRRAREARVGT